MLLFLKNDCKSSRGCVFMPLGRMRGSLVCSNPLSLPCCDAFELFVIYVVHHVSLYITFVGLGLQSGLKDLTYCG